MDLFIISIFVLVVTIGVIIFNVNNSKKKKKIFELVSSEEILIAKNNDLCEQVDLLTKKASELLRSNRTLSEENSVIKSKLNRISEYKEDTEVATQGIIRQAQDVLLESQQQSKKVKNELLMKKHEADLLISSANDKAERIISLAKQKAEEIAGDAYLSMEKAREFSDTVQALKNIIKGYGDEYIVPTYSLIDELADEIGYTEAGQQLKAARTATRLMVKEGKAATCDYVEMNRKETAVRFIVDAFNGKVDSILSRGKADNHGKLAQEIRDSYSLVNHNGSAFRNAKITEGYLMSRLEELKWNATAHALKEKEREEQRQIREQIREEEKARKEFERALKESEKEEDSIKKAMEKIQQKVAEATEVQRIEYEAKLRDLETKLQAAEEKSQRALSMAQQTKAGHVYVISNIGSFGENVFKIGMTRRLDPQERVRELGDASVPFAFDVHAMIFSEDSPDLEKKLHRHFLKMQMNKVNPRKEFFRVSLSDIKRELDALGVETNWTMAAAAFEYRESLKIEQQMQQNQEVAQRWEEHQLSIEIEEEAEELV